MGRALREAPSLFTDFLSSLPAEPLPDDLQELLEPLPRSDLYLQDEMQVALHPTLTRVWCRKGRQGQRLVEAPGRNLKVYGFGLVDWRDGWFHSTLAPGRTAQAFCEQLRAAVARSQERGRVALVLCDNLRTHTPEGSREVRQLLAELQGKLRLVYTPAYDPDSNPMEWLWRVVRQKVTHNHRRPNLELLTEDLEERYRHFREHPDEVLRHLGSPGPRVQPAVHLLALAA